MLFPKKGKTMNWKLRFQNKTTLVAIVLAIISFIYYGLDMFHIIPPFEQEQIVNLCTMAIDILCLLGIVTDPTTHGIGDSDRAMTYQKPYKDGE